MFADRHSDGRYRQAADLGEDDIGGFGPDEGLGVGVVLIELAFDGGLEVDDGFEDAAPEASSSEGGEEVLDGIEKTDQLLMSVLLHAAAEHHAVQDIKAANRVVVPWRL